MLILHDKIPFHKIKGLTSVATLLRVIFLAQPKTQITLAKHLGLATRALVTQIRKSKIRENIQEAVKMIQAAAIITIGIAASTRTLPDFIRAFKLKINPLRVIIGTILKNQDLIRIPIIIERSQNLTGYAQ